MILYTIMTIIYAIGALILQASSSEFGILWAIIGMLLIYNDYKKNRGKK